MMNSTKEDILLGVLKEQLVPALGCTEPVAVALCAATARKYTSGDIDRILVTVSKSIYKNGARVTIPGTHEKGLEIAASLGAVAGHQDAGMQVLQGISEDDVDLARKYVQQGKVQVKVEETRSVLYIQSRIITSNGYAVCVIENEHTNVVYLEANGKIIRGKREDERNTCSSGSDAAPAIQGYSLGDFKEFADNIDLQKIGFISDAITMNSELAERGLQNTDNWGSKFRKLLLNRGINPDKSLMHYPVVLAMSAVYERMNGAAQPAMTLTGSGNQGIGAILPLVAIKRIEDLDDEALLRSVSLACLVTIYTKSHTGVLSPICGGGSITSSAVSGGIAYMMGGSLQQIEKALQNTFASTVGMLCDGAKTSCALKVATGTSAAVSNALLALDDVGVPGADGIISARVEGTIENLGYLVTRGMGAVDGSLIDILSNSKEERM